MPTKNVKKLKKKTKIECNLFIFISNIKAININRWPKLSLLSASYFKHLMMCWAGYFFFLSTCPNDRIKRWPNARIFPLDGASHLSVWLLYSANVVSSLPYLRYLSDASHLHTHFPISCCLKMGSLLSRAETNQVMNDLLGGQLGMSTKQTCAHTLDHYHVCTY